MLERMLENRGVQMMLANLIKSASPELVQHIDQFTSLLKQFDDRMTRIEKLVETLAKDLHDDRERGNIGSDNRGPFEHAGNRDQGID